MNNDNNRRVRKHVLMFMIVIMIIFSISTIVLSADQWDRPIVSINFTPIYENMTEQFNNLQQQLYNETAQRISNDSYLQSQINITNINITQLFSITTIYGINITQLFNITYNLQTQINDIEYDIDDINDNISSLNNIVVVLNESINSINNTLTNFTTLFNTTIEYLNDTIYQINASIKQPIGKYINWNTTNFWINETELNNTINDISENKQYLYIDSINVTSGIGYFTTNYTIEYLLTRITINGLGIYRSECVEYINGTIIDKNRIPHNTVWDIEKNYAINDNINCTIINANTDGIFNITLTYIDNGLV